MRKLIASVSIIYISTLIAVPILDRELDVLRTFPEHYDAGPAGLLVRVGYAAVALMTTGIVVVALREGDLLERFGAVLLAAAVPTTALLVIAPQEVSGGWLLAGVFCLAVAPAIIAFAGRHRSPRWTIAAGAIVPVGFVLFALAPETIEGLANRVWDVLLGLWGFAYSFSGRRAHPTDLPRRPSS